MQLIDRVISFLEITGMPRTKFSQKVGLSPITVYNWLRGKQTISEKASNRISHFIDECIMKVKEI